MSQLASPRIKSLSARILVISIPATFKQAGGRKQIVTPPGSAEWRPTQQRCSSSLISAVAKAHLWRGLIEMGRYASAAELARKERLNESYVCRVLRLTLLAPEIVEAILDGSQPQTLELRALMRPLPSEWSAQRKLLGFAQG